MIMRAGRAAIVTMAVLAVSFTAGVAQQRANVPRIGFLTAFSPSDVPVWREGFRQGLRDLGYTEGQNIIVEYRYAQGHPERLPGLAADLVKLKVDVTAAARPGGNVTGLSLQLPDLAAKRLQLLQEAVPGIARVAVLWNSSSPITPPQLSAAETAASALGMQLESIGVRTQDDFERAFQAATRRRAGALLILDDFFLTSHLTRIAVLTAKARLPALAGVTGFAEAGVLISYGPNFTDITRRSVTYVDKILRGAKPGDLPIEQPTTFELVINAKSAKALGLAMPSSLLVRADKIIQ